MHYKNFKKIYKATVYKAILAFKNAAKDTPIMIRGILRPFYLLFVMFLLFFIYFQLKTKSTNTKTQL